MDKIKTHLTMPGDEQLYVSPETYAEYQQALEQGVSQEDANYILEAEWVRNTSQGIIDNINVLLNNFPREQINGMIDELRTHPYFNKVKDET